MILTEFNELSRDAALSTLRPALDIPRWQEEIVDARPFTSVQSVQELALTAAQPFTETEIDRALAHHPKIGERDGSESVEARLSRAEQASLGSTSDDDAERLKQGNRDYEERFGHVFLIRAAGRSHPEILAELTRRMKNDPQSERAEVAEQLRDIAALRIEGMLS